MAVITLQVDTSAARAALNGVNQAITQIKVNGATVTIGGKNVAGQLKQIQAGAAEAGKKVNAVTKETTNKAINGIKATTSQFKQGVGIIKSLANGVVSWWTAIIIAIEMATKAGTYFFNNLTESIPKLNQRMDNLNNQVKKNYQSWEKQKQVSDQYNVSLKELSEKQTLTNTEQVLAQALIDKLKEKYKGLNLSIDQTTGALKGYIQAVSLMERQDAEAERNLIQRQINAKKEQVDARLAQTFGTDKVTLAQADADKMFTNAENWFGDISSLARQQMSMQWNSGSLQDKLKILNDLATRYSNNQTILKTINGSITAMEQLIDLQKKYGDLVDANNIILNNAKKILEESRQIVRETNELNNQADKIYESIAEAQEQEMFDALGSEQDKINYLQQKIDALRKEEEELNGKVGDIESIERNPEALAQTSKSLKNSIKEDKKEIKQLNDEISKIKRNFQKSTGKPLSLNTTQIKKDIAEADKLINADPNRHGNGIIGAVLDSSQRTDAQKNKAFQTQQLAAAQKVLNLQAKRVKLDDQVKDLTAKLRANEQAYKKAVAGGLADENTLAQLKKRQAQIAKELYNKEKQQGKLRDQIAGKQLKTLEQEEEARKKAADAEAELAAKRKDINRNFFQSNRNNQVTQYLKLIGKQREALILEQKINLARALGLKSIKQLTKAQGRGIERQVDLQMKLDQLSNMNGINIDRPNIISNELARKGGFASSVVVERNNVNKQILNAAQQQVSLQNTIKNEISKYGVIG